MLRRSGTYDSLFPFEVSRKPFFRLLGTPAMKRHVLNESGRFLRPIMMRKRSPGWISISDPCNVGERL